MILFFVYVCACIGSQKRDQASVRVRKRDQNALNVWKWARKETFIQSIIQTHYYYDFYLKIWLNCKSRQKKIVCVRNSNMCECMFVHFILIHDLFIVFFSSVRLSVSSFLFVCVVLSRFATVVFSVLLTHTHTSEHACMYIVHCTQALTQRKLWDISKTCSHMLHTHTHAHAY